MKSTTYNLDSSVSPALVFVLHVIYDGQGSFLLLYNSQLSMLSLFPLMLYNKITLLSLLKHPIYIFFFLSNSRTTWFFNCRLWRHIFLWYNVSRVWKCLWSHCLVQHFIASLWHQVNHGMKMFLNCLFIILKRYLHEWYEL
jgi:hypothetical protein